uniref:Ovule protein n=1 Tax=Haemonchus contortus TaxID=6289 RepID=A0A7I4YQS4_HAECO
STYFSSAGTSDLQEARHEPKWALPRAKHRIFSKKTQTRAKMEQETPLISMCCLYCRHCVAFVHSRSNTL